MAVRKTMIHGNQAGNGLHTRSAANHANARELSRMDGVRTGAKETVVSEGNARLDTTCQNLRDPCQKSSCVEDYLL
jgi:hypothetical protein